MKGTKLFDYIAVVSEFHSNCIDQSQNILYSKSASARTNFTMECDKQGCESIGYSKVLVVHFTVLTLISSINFFTLIVHTKLFINSTAVRFSAFFECLPITLVKTFPKSPFTIPLLLINPMNFLYTEWETNFPSSYINYLNVIVHD